MNHFAVIPAYNEGKSIGPVVFAARNFVERVIVVDDGSLDDTFQRSEQAGAIVLRHRINMGKGAALKTGCDYALRQGAEGLVVLDADGQHNPSEIPVFFKALQDHDLVLGSRVVPKSMPLVLSFGNKVINSTLNFLYGMRIQDSQCGYRAFTAATYQSIRWQSLNYFIETEMVIKAGRKKLRYTQIPIETIYTDNYKGTTVVDGLTIVMKMLGGKIFK